MDYIVNNNNFNINITNEEFLEMIGNTSSLLESGRTNLNTSDPYNNGTTTITIHGYPSGYSLGSIIFASVIVTSK